MFIKYFMKFIKNRKKLNLVLWQLFTAKNKLLYNLSFVYTILNSMIIQINLEKILFIKKKKKIIQNIVCKFLETIVYLYSCLFGEQFNMVVFCGSVNSILLYFFLSLILEQLFFFVLVFFTNGVFSLTLPALWNLCITFLILGISEMILKC